MSLFSKLHARLGDLWWYSILYFCASRFADVINMFVGLWIVPKYVPTAELGAVLPLTQVISFIGVPLLILSIPFSRYLSVFIDKGEPGKAKAFVRDVFVGTIILAIVSILFAYFVLPFFFERIRVIEGSLGLLVIVVCVMSAFSTVIGNAVQGLRLYSVSVWISLAAAPLRLVLMLIFMPFRALSGYIVGQGAMPFCNIAGSVWAVWKYFRQSDVSCEPYWREYGGSILRYTIPITLWTVIITLSGSVDALVIRHRLSDFESAAYYMITRFSDIAGYFGVAFMAFLFPMVAGSNKSEAEARRLLWHSVLGTLLSGAAVAVVLFFTGKYLMFLQPMWAGYTFFVPHMAVLAFFSALTMVGNCIVTYHFARGAFGFLKFAAPYVLLKIVGLYLLGGYGFFRGILPDAVMDALVAFNPCRLSVVIGFITIAQFIFDGLLILHILCKRPVTC